MTLRFLQETPDSILGKLKTDLSYIDPTVDFSVYESMTYRGVEKELDEISKSISNLKTGTYGSWLHSEGYVRDTLVKEALENILENKANSMEAEDLVPGASYYTGVSRFGDLLEGQYAIYLGENYTGWIEFRESAAVAKAMTVLRYGSEVDFKEIYIGMADGSVDALNEVSLSHIAKSSPAALGLIEEYCDARWEGPWPWEVEAPEKIKHMIESREEEKMIRITEMQNSLAKLLREFDEGNLNQFEMVSAAQEMMAKVDSIISDLGKLSSTGIEVMAQAKASGDDNLVQPMQNALGDPLNQAVSALTDLKASLATATSDLSNGGGGSAMPDTDMGSPDDMMGDDPMAGGSADADALADVDIGGDDEERPMKEL